MNFDKLIAIFDADWDESKHPRAKNGQFGKGNGGSSAPAKKEKKSTMSKSYKALSAGQKAEAKANVASQIKSMSREKQISVANRVLKAQGKEPIVANKDGTYTWTNKGERVTTQKPPRIKSDKLARAIVANGYAVPGIKTGVSAETAKASASATKPEPTGGMTKEQLSAAARQAAKMNSSGGDYQDFKKLTSTKITPKLRKAVESNLTQAGENIYEEIHDKGGLHISRADIHQAATLIKGSLRNNTSSTDTLDKIVGIIYKGTKRGPIYGDIARRLLKEVHNIIK